MGGPGVQVHADVQRQDVDPGLTYALEFAQKLMITGPKWHARVIVPDQRIGQKASCFIESRFAHDDFTAASRNGRMAGTSTSGFMQTS